MNKSSGNVLFLILIAVALFAALSYAITSSTRNGDGSVSADKAKASAGVIIQYGAVLRNAVMRLKLSNDCTDTTLDFSNSIYKNNNNSLINSINSNAPSSKKCNVFHPLGGNISPVIPPQDTWNYASPYQSVGTVPKLGHGGVVVGQVKGVGTDAAAGTVSSNELSFYLTFLSKEACMAINDLLNIPNPSNAPPPGTITGTNGSYTNGSLASNAIQDNGPANGLAAFCSGTAPSYTFIQVLVER